MDRVKAYECVICKSISAVWSERYLNMDYVKLNCCSIRCKNKYIMYEILEKYNNLPSDINKIIVEEIHPYEKDLIKKALTFFFKAHLN